MALGDLWGIGHRLAARLAELGITDPLMLRQADPRFIRERFSVVVERTVLELRGIACIALEEAPPDRKSVMASRSFGRTVETREEMEEAVASHATRAAEKLRRQGLAAGRLMVFIETNRFREEDRQYSREQAIRLPVATADTGRLITAALAALSVIWKGGYRYKKAGVMLLELSKAESVRGDLFHAPDDTRSQARMKAVDALNARFGQDTVAYAATGTAKAWEMKRTFMSPRYTTSWAELLRV